jgi:glucosyl-dolichyl phosphate glucuronosyltransferase
MTSMRFALSIIIATIDRYEVLERCLEAMTPSVQSTLEPYEVIVVDQTPSERLQRDIKHRFPFVNHQVVGRIGLSVARNHGIEQAHSDVVAFLDDDAVADRRWVDAMIASFRGPGQAWVQVCGGRVVADYGHLKRPSWLKPPLERFLSCIDFGDAAGPLQEGQWVVGANLAMRRGVVEALGGFDTALGRRGRTNLLSNEEAALVQSVGREHVLYNPAAMVWHLIRPERLSQAWFRTRVCWQAVSDVLSCADYLTSRREWRAVEEVRLEGTDVAALLADAPDYDTLDRHLTMLYDLTTDTLTSGLLGSIPLSLTR